MCTKLHMYRINTATKSQSPLRSSPQHYLIQYQSLSLNLARAHTRPTQQKQSRFSLPRRPPRKQGRNALRASAPSASFLRAGHRLHPAFADPSGGCREVPSPSPASFQTPQTKRKRKANLSLLFCTHLKSGWWRTTRRIASIAASKDGQKQPP